MKKQRINILLITFFMSAVLQAQTNKPAIDYLSVPGPVVFQSKSYNLNWSSHPATGFYKQEYIVKGDNADKYKTMVLIDVLTGETKIKSVVNAKVEEIKKQKAVNPMVNYEVISNPKTGEYMIDFLLIANASDGSTSIVERNVYRYKAGITKTGEMVVLLFGISTRAYGANVDNFFVALKANRKDLINTVAQYSVPEISIKK